MLTNMTGDYDQSWRTERISSSRSNEQCKENILSFIAVAYIGVTCLSGHSVRHTEHDVSLKMSCPLLRALILMSVRKSALFFFLCDLQFAPLMGRGVVCCELKNIFNSPVRQKRLYLGMKPAFRSSRSQPVVRVLMLGRWKCWSETQDSLSVEA